ncbi:thiamine-phosphate synthase family protein [Halopenitus sp. POP-27]|uniref:thiamine-phosphate synthase family protein n=1 Tax=Halopenitus sp. POP-27 TaxID=2994425 RepID=UPI002469498E|nr:thiamine-phosphate synthase family protein [Halopenitus sp. POP-27]
MSLRLPGEIVVDHVLPTLRVELATELADYGLTQREIADELGVTQAAVSTYLSGDASTTESIAAHPRTRSTVERVAEGLATGEMNGYDALAAVLDLVQTLEDRGPVCEIHETEMPALQGLSCDLCIRGRDEAVSTEQAALASVRKAARVLSTTVGVARFVPNVGSNVGTALPDAAEPTDVAAIPGRIYTVDDRVEVPANPEFGASNHVATIVLAAADVDPGVRGAVNLTTDDALLTAVRDRGVDPLAFDAEYDDRGRRLRDRFADRGAVPRVVFHRGAFGIEPITYVLGTDAADAARFAADLVTDVVGE